MHGPREVTFYQSLFGDEVTELPLDIQQLIPHYHGIKIIQDMRAEQMCSHVLLKYCATDLLEGRGDSIWSKTLCNGLKVQWVCSMCPKSCSQAFDTSGLWLIAVSKSREGISSQSLARYLWIFLSLSPKLHVILSSVENAQSWMRRECLGTRLVHGLVYIRTAVVWHSKIISWWIEGEHL